MSQFIKKTFYAYTETAEYEKASEREDLSYDAILTEKLSIQDHLEVDAKINNRVAAAEENAFTAGFNIAMKMMR